MLSLSSKGGGFDVAGETAGETGEEVKGREG
jgi:hypothetical protein